MPQDPVEAAVQALADSIDKTDVVADACSCADCVRNQ